VVLPARFVKVVVEIRAGRDQAVDETVLDECAPPPAQRRPLSAPAMPMKMVTSSSSIFCHTRCAMPGERP
jgi:hypothetical protein